MQTYSETMSQTQIGVGAAYQKQLTTFYYRAYSIMLLETISLDK